jgi:hypothetical protein
VDQTVQELENRFFIFPRVEIDMRLFSAHPHKVSVLDSEDHFVMISYQDTAPQNIGYFFSLPERTIRALAILVGGLVFEVTEVLLPGWLRRSRLYQATIGGLLRIAIELVGGVAGILPSDEMDIQEFTMRKAAGTGVELAGFLAMGWSPIWLFAVAADITGGTRTYLQALVTELQRDGMLPEEADISSIEELLDALEGTSGIMAEMLDVPPLNVDDMRRSWQGMRQHVNELPDAGRLTSNYSALQQIAEQEDQTLLSVSSLIALGAARAGVQVGQTHIFDYYQDALRTINKEGLPIYAKRVSRPYLTAAKSHFNPQRITYTERFLQRMRKSKV